MGGKRNGERGKERKEGRENEEEERGGGGGGGEHENCKKKFREVDLHHNLDISAVVSCSV